MVDLVPLIATAKRLIKENGRSVSFIKHDKTLAISTQPWEGPTAARGTGSIKLVLDVVFVDPDPRNLGRMSVTEDLIQRSEQIMIVVPSTNDLATFEEILDTDGTYWKIVGTQLLKPGNTAALAYVGVKR